MRNYDAFKAPTHFRIERPADEVRQDLRRDQGRRYALRLGRGDRHQGRHREAPRRSLELPVHRRDVVPGPVQLRLPAHRDVHHPLRHPAGGDLVLRLQHRRRLAEHHRADAHDRHAHQVVRGARPARDLRRQQGRCRCRQRRTRCAERRRRRQGRADRPRRAGRGQERARGTAPGAQAQGPLARGRAAPRRDGAVVPPARAEGTGRAGGADPGSEEGAAGRHSTVHVH